MVEYCAGTGRLTEAIREELARQEQKKHGNGQDIVNIRDSSLHAVLIDRTQSRNTADLRLGGEWVPERANVTDNIKTNLSNRSADNEHRPADQVESSTFLKSSRSSCTRLVADIINVDLSKVPVVAHMLNMHNNKTSSAKKTTKTIKTQKQSPNSSTSTTKYSSTNSQTCISFVGKHVCGSAADVSIENALNLASKLTETRQNTPSDSKHSVQHQTNRDSKGRLCIAFALCCHHLCDIELMSEHGTFFLFFFSVFVSCCVVV